MTQLELTYPDSGIAPLSRRHRTRRTDAADETQQTGLRSVRLGALIVLLTATVFYGGIAFLVWKWAALR
jgi:hypothetical protein